MKNNFFGIIYRLSISVISILFIFTLLELQPTYQNIQNIKKNSSYVLVLDSQNKPLNLSYQNRFNIFNNITYEKIPEKLKKILIFSEDKKFYEHSGVDWLSRLNAFFLNVKNAKIKRGASTITEQVVKIIHRRNRNLWSKWLEGWEAFILEKSMSKNEILEFYMNQVPFASNRLGFQQSSNFYFDKTINNLSLKEILFLVINLQSPSTYNPHRNQNSDFVEQKVLKLANNLYKSELITELELLSIHKEKLKFKQNNLNTDNKHFLINIKKNSKSINKLVVKTSLNLSLQSHVNNLLKTTLKYFDKQNYNVKNAAALVLNRKNMQVISYNSISLQSEIDGDIDSVLVVRQPASTLKPFLYGLALQNGFSLSSKVVDEPISQPILLGKHDFFNASHKFYGEISFREALANSLNVPALKVINVLGVEKFFTLLRNLGFSNLKNEPNYYNLGLAIGATEANLFELIEAYSVLANHGTHKGVKLFQDDNKSPEKEIFSSQIASLITTVLSDRISRRIEFSRDSILNFPSKTAVKTGTSTDYKDAWALGYDDDYVVGVWLGNLDYQSMNQMSGALGAGLILRNIFNEIHKKENSKPSAISKNLVKKNINDIDEYFSENASSKVVNVEDLSKNTKLKISYPFNNSEFSFDPHVNSSDQKLFFKSQNLSNFRNVKWMINEVQLKNQFWEIRKGRHVLTLQGEDTSGKLSKDSVTFFCH